MEKKTRVCTCTVSYVRGKEVCYTKTAVLPTSISFNSVMTVLDAFRPPQCADCTINLDVKIVN